MNPKEYVEKSVHLGVASGSQTMDEVASIIVRPEYPEPTTNAGVVLFAGPRGDVNGVDWALDSLRGHIERVIGYVVDDCISVVQQQDAVPEESRKAISRAIRENFDI